MATKRTHKRELAIAALLSTRNIKLAAAQCGMSFSTLYEWLRKDEEFKAMYAAEKKSVLDEIKTSLLQSAVTSAKVLQDGLNDEMESYVSRFPLAKFSLETILNLEISEAVLAKIDQPSTNEWDCVPSATKSDEEDAE